MNNFVTSVLSLYMKYAYLRYTYMEKLELIDNTTCDHVVNYSFYA